MPKAGPGQGLPAPHATRPKAKAVPQAEKKQETPAKEAVSLVPKKQKTPAKKTKEIAEEEAAERSLEEARAEISLNVALEDMQKRVNERERAGQQSYGSGGGSVSGSGTGTGSGGGTPADVYGGIVWEKIQQKWALPENFPRSKSQLLTIVDVIIERDGTVQKAWIEKESGDPVYDQMAMRAIKKAEPFPPFLAGMTEHTFVRGFRFRPTK